MSRNLLSIADLTRDEIEELLDVTDSMVEVSGRNIPKVPALRGRTVVSLFYEDSTRTRLSFDAAAKRLSADTMSFSTTASSVTKGETLIDTALNIQAMGVDAFVLRHSAAGAPHLLARHVKVPVINAGDGCHEHPTQGLLDMFTIREAFGKFEGLTVAIIGDIRHSRVARSDAWGLTKLGARVILAGPPTLVPRAIGAALGVEVSHDIDSVIREADVINCLRIQFERKAANYFPGTREYAAIYGLNAERVKRCKPKTIIMHPGPINRGIEIDSEIADCGRSVILEQVTNGLAVRMAVLFLVNGGKGPQEVTP